MKNLIEKYMEKISKEDVNNFALSKNIMLSDEELNFVYDFITKNYKEMLNSPNLFDIDRYKTRFSPGNFEKIKKVFIEYFSKYQRLL